MNVQSKKYIGWMALNSWATSTMNVLSTNSMLSSIMGNSPSFSSLITTTYVGKDIIGQLGGLSYAWKTGKKADKQPLVYITKGSVIQQVSFYLENASVFVTNSKLILPFLGLSSTLKNVSFISLGAVNANNIQKLSPQGVGEFYSKVAGINTISSTVGMITGIALLQFVPSYTLRTFCIMPLLSVIGVYSLRKATIVSN